MIRPHDAEIDRDDRAVGFDEKIALMHVGVEIAGLDRLLEKRVHQPVGDRVQIMTGRDQRLTVGNLDAVDPVEREDPARGPVPVNRGNLVLVYLGHMLGQFRSAGRFTAQIQFAHRPAAEIGNDQLRAQTFRLAPQSLEMGGGPFIGFNIPAEFLDDARTQHLDRHILAFQCGRPMHLSDGGGADRIGVDMTVQFVQRLAETEFDLVANLRKRNGRQAVLQLQQIARGRFADDVGTGGQRLAQLDRRRPDCLQRCGIIWLFRLERPDPRDTEQTPHLRWCRLVLLEIAQRTMFGKRAAPFEQAENMGTVAGHPWRLLRSSSRCE